MSDRQMSSGHIVLRRPFTVLVVIPATLAISGVLTTTAGAQNALGDGHGLDANPQVGSGGRNLPGIVEDFRARNRVVTGEVGDGREFRDSVGYVGERAFSAPLPSDQFFRFRADSAASSIQNVMTGRSLDRFNLAASGGVFAFDRDFTAPLAGAMAIGPRSPMILERVDLDSTSRSSGVGRVLERSAGTSIVGTGIDDDGTSIAVLGGPITGLRFEEMRFGIPPRTDLPMMDMRALSMEMANEVPGAIVPGVPFRSALLDPDAIVDGRPVTELLGLGADARERFDVDGSLRQDAQANAQRQRLTGERDYEAIIARIVGQYGLDPSVTFSGDREMMTELVRQLDDLRVRLQTAPPDPTALPSIRDRLDAELDPEAIAVPTEPAEGADAAPNPDDVALSQHLLRALRHGRTVEELSPFERTRLAEHIGRGESLLADGQFMLAERYFDRALQIVPKHPMALAGLVNTQIGAGLYLSAAINLHQLLAAHPEMIDARYGERILPSPSRIEIATDALRRRLAAPGRPDRADHGMLLAYLGHQISDRNLVLEGLAALREENPQSSLLPVLEAIWLEE